MSRWDDRDDVKRGGDYDERWAAMADRGESVHGEVDLIEHLLGVTSSPVDAGSVLDAGCGTGRIAIELASRGIDVAGVDLDAGMLDEAIAKAPDLSWTQGDLVAVDLDREFDIVVMAGNVMIFVAAGTEAAVVANMARHVRASGLLVAGFQLSGGRLALDEYDRHCVSAGLEFVDRWSTWGRDPFGAGDYAVSVHRRS